MKADKATFRPGKNEFKYRSPSEDGLQTINGVREVHTTGRVETIINGSSPIRVDIRHDIHNGVFNIEYISQQDRIEVTT